ncbi:carboxypeptidase regulatory-like domain-containing protein [Micromonospora sp. NPDC047644]|uniref:carboxypeptidase regulatory-like domain-containing protein n=1 Tax=Micromonospora sp. NPDC047644 TaxID=3157203 RepID=UPI003455B6FC
MQLFPARRALLAGAVVAALVLPGATPAQAAATGAVSGRLTTSAGAPAAEVLVQIYPADDYESVGYTNTDADGNYTVDGLPAGSYRVGYFPWLRPEQYYHQKSQMSDAESVTVAAGATTTVDEQLFDTGTINGRLVDAYGRPAPSVSISANEIDTYGWAGALTDEDGRFTINALPGRYRVSFNPIEGSYQTQYVPGKLDEDGASVFEVKADAATEVNETVLPVGSLTGRFTTASGAPLADAEVSITTANSYGGAWTQTDPNGEFSVEVLQGPYKVGVSTGDRQQYYRGKLTPEAADVVQVRGGQQTTITDSLLGTGSITVNAVDSITGAPVANFCAQSACSNGTGTVTVSDLPQGQHDIFLYAPDGHYFSRQLDGVRVRADRTTTLTVKLRPGAVISTTIVDRQSGAPLSDVCLDAFLPKQATLRDNVGECSDRNGRVQVGPLAAGSYKLFATPQSRSYGRQWVGAEGGTGDERQAVTVVATVGQVATGPQVKVDRAGKVTGAVTDGAGKPLANIDVSVLTGHPGLGVQDATTNERGVYTIERLGPYAWPLVFAGHPYANEWSGDKRSRFTATPVTVTAGATATHNTQLDQGVGLTGTFRTPDGTPFTGGFVVARSADTGDIAGSGWITEGRFEARLKGPQRIFFTYEASLGEGQQVSGRYLVTQPDGSRKLALYTVPTSGSTSVDLVVPVD